MNLTAPLGLAIVVFASTNIDDIFVLIGFFADARFRARNVAIGQYLGIGALVLVSLAASLISVFLAPAYVGLLGVLPILIGVKRLVDLRRDAGEKPRPEETRGGALGQIASIAAVTFANGGDNLGVYAPLFATQSAPGIVITVIVFLAMTALWIAMARRLLAQPTIGAFIRRYGRIAVPFVLIGLGLAILYDAGSIALLGSAAATRP
jgi:cadmium resistance transport/sequestration family protein